MWFASKEIPEWIFDSGFCHPKPMTGKEWSRFDMLAGWLVEYSISSHKCSVNLRETRASMKAVSECKQSQEAFETSSNNSRDIRLNSPEQSHEDDENGVERKALKARKHFFSLFCYVTASCFVAFFNDFLILILRQAETLIVLLSSSTIL
jgi:hypothetical protein